MIAEPTVVAARRGRIGHILLNRPAALNALDLDMLRAVAVALDSWRDDPAVHAVVIEGAGGRAFCAGGDIRAVRTAVLEGRHSEIETFFTEEYALNGAIAAYPKPYVALVDGICMGGGIGVSVHGAARVVTDAALFAMPETGIALFPDVGASYLLPRLRGAIGLYMALVGSRLTGADAVHAGLATHFTERTTLPGLADALAEHGMAALGDVSRPFDAPLAAHQAAIDHCFTAATLPEIIQRLDTVDTEWSRQTLITLRANSPSALLWTFRLMSLGATRTLPECLAAELALTRHVTRHPDFVEGVRAMVVDKDRTPAWVPARLEDVDPALIDAVFAG